MGLWQTLTGRTKPKPADLSDVFALPGAGLSLEAGLDLRPTGDASICYRLAGGPAGREVEQDVVALLRADPKAPEVSLSVDEFGYTWLLVDDRPEDPSDLTDVSTALHAVTTGLEAAGYGSGLLCAVVPFVDPSGRRVALVYLYKQATFYPFAPLAGGPGGRSRDELLELQVRDLLARELPFEQDPSRWLAVWGAPGL
ncbi:hypothetical protein K8Z61_07515 [Nocardioides sp. TRM66260-LWL]|uniref:PspA-associated protein PspAB n=1 Tax=Nocardioides sp. TRM66260-LWL TaxID=2874478 RepID=UPI001CC60A33|nr:hypothetical protein [Nocardioides sp. TRM66260-LWL]MBZ5734341.1 hypothetical protein [Nocardioides sp. TRM66260-LWL]